MSKRRASQGKRCLKCKIHHTLCFCHEIQTMETRSRVSIIMHHRERYLTSNTANLATMVLPKAQICLRGLPEKPFTFSDLKIEPEEKALYLFPHENAVVLDHDFLEQYKNQRFHLVVPDGTWTQAVKCYRREKELECIQCVKLPAGKPGRYRLRKSSDENKLSTFEAISRALGILENNQDLEIKMDEMFDIMVEKVIRGRTAFEN